MTLEEIRVHPFYTALTDKQRAYIEARIAGKDKITAATQAFECKNPQSIRSAANAAEKHENIAWLLQQFFGHFHVPNRNEFLGLIWKKCSQSQMDEKVQFDYLKLFAETSGYRTKPAENLPEQRPDDGNDAPIPI